MRIHFDPYNDGDPSETAPCGTHIGDEYDGTSQWSKVTCKRCLKNKKRLQASVEAIEKEIIRQMGDMADFIRK